MFAAIPILTGNPSTTHCFRDRQYLLARVKKKRYYTYWTTLFTVHTEAEEHRAHRHSLREGRAHQIVAGAAHQDLFLLVQTHLFLLPAETPQSVDVPVLSE